MDNIILTVSWARSLFFLDTTHWTNQEVTLIYRSIISKLSKNQYVGLLHIKMINAPLNHFHRLSFSVFCVVYFLCVLWLTVWFRHLGIRDKVSDWDEFLRQTLAGACSPPVPLLEGVSIIASRIRMENF